MAVQHGYGKIAGTDALVFAYDTGDTRNSFKGRPTVNQFLHHGVSGKGSAADNFVTFPTQGTAGFKRLGYGQTFGDYTIKPEDVVYRYDNVNSVACHYHGNTASVPEGVYVVFSFDFYLSPTITVENGSIANVENYGNGALSGGVTGVNANTEKGVWHRRVQIYGPKVGATPGTQAMFLYPGGCSARLSSTPGYILYKNPQVEFVNYTTESPFVQGTRSATEGLLDLTGTTSIDLSNVSFDSDGMFQFDGTDDRIFAGNPSELSLSNGIGSIEAVVKFPRSWTGGSQYPNLICKGARAGWDTPGWALFGFRDWPNANNKSWGLGLRNASGSVRTVAKYDIPTDVYLHLLATMDGTTMKLYENGILVSTNTQTVIPAENAVNVFIGGDDGSNRFPGDIPVVKVYNKALTASEVLSNFNNYRNRFSDLSNYYDNSSDGGRWIRWWWYTGVGWPGHETEALGHPFGTFDSSSHYGFQRLPEGLNKDSVELLAKDGDGNIYKWDFADTSGTAQTVWDSFTQGTQGVWANNGAFMPTVIAGGFHGGVQDTWQYRVSEGVASFLLDDDSCDCVSTLNAGHAMCGGSGWSQTYAQPDGAYLRYGVDTLNDGGCRGPVPERTLELFYRIK